MRLDKFLKVSRIIKRRTVAKEVCDNGYATVDGRVAKASTEVKAGDILAIRIGNRHMEVKVTSTPEVVKAQEAATLYEVIENKVSE